MNGLHDYAEYQAMKRFKPDGYRWIELLLRKTFFGFIPEHLSQGYCLSQATVEMMERLRVELNIPRIAVSRTTSKKTKKLRGTKQTEQGTDMKAEPHREEGKTIDLNDDGFVYSYTGFRYFNEYVGAQREARIHMLKAIGFTVCYEFDLKTCRERLMVTHAKRFDRSAFFPVTETLIANPAKVRVDFAAEYDISIADAKALFASASLGGALVREAKVWNHMESGYNDYLRQRLEQDDTLRSLREECKQRQKIFQREGAYSVLTGELDFVDGRYYKKGEKTKSLTQRQLYWYLCFHEELEVMNVIRARMKHLGIRALYVHDGFYTEQLIRRTPEELASDLEMEVVIQAGYPIGIKIKQLLNSQFDIPVNNTTTSTISNSLINNEVINPIEKSSATSFTIKTDDSYGKPPEPASLRPKHLSDVAISLGSRAEWE